MNLSSSDEEEDYGYSSNDDDIKGILYGEQQQQQQQQRFDHKSSDAKLLSSITPPFTSVAAGNQNNEYNQSDSDEYEDVDWEDASVASTHTNQQDHQVDIPRVAAAAAAASSSHRIFPTQDVILNWEDSPELSSSDNKRHDGESREGKKDKPRRLNKIRNLPNHMQRFIRDLHRTHMLCLMSRGAFLSGCILGSMEEEEIWSIAHSLIPPEFVFIGDEDEPNITNAGENESIQVPCIKKVQKFCMWFFDWVKNVEQRRNETYASNIAAGAPRLRRTRTSNTRTRSNSKKRQQESNSSKDVSFPSTSFSTTKNNGSYWNQRLKDIMEYLSPVNDNNPQQYDGQNHPGEMTINPLEKVILFICMTRSLKWRVRLVFSLDPMARELTVDHPLFHNTMMHTFQRIAKSIETKNQAGKKRKRGKHNQKDQVAAQYTMSMANMKTSLSSYLGSESYRDFVWAEVLCQKPKFGKGNATATTTTSHHRWVHVDPTFCLFDEPMKVEMIDLETSSLKQGKNRNRIFKPVSYVLGVENFHDLPEMSSYSMGSTSQWLLNTTKLTDVTPRYANKWSVTLKIRGANAKNIAQGKCVNDWWRQTLQRINHAFVKKRADVGLSTLCMDGARSCSRSRHSRLNHRDISSSTPSYKVETESRGNNKVDILIIDDDEGEGEDMKEQLLASNRNSEKRLNHEQHDVDQTEQREFESMKGQEAIPTNKAAFKNHPLYVIPSMMKKQEVLAPDAKRRISGIFKGEMVYRRSDVSMAFPAKKWLYQGRKVIEKELPKPAKIIKARKKPTLKGFQTLSTYGVMLGKQEDSLKDVDSSLQSEEDANTKLYGIWQTIRWSPPYVGPNDPIPVNEHNNVELALLNPGLAHVELYRIAKVAKQLGIPYAPCLIGFEGHGGNRTPTIRGIVVHRHNVDLLNEAHVEMQSQLVENEVKERQQAIYGRWKRLIKGLLTRDRIAREYAND